MRIAPRVAPRVRVSSVENVGSVQEARWGEKKKMGKRTKRETRTRQRRDKQKGRGRKRKGWKRRRKQEDQNVGKEKR